jgi:benzylsuccinate CoA-transferase BbsE subunit
VPSSAQPPFALDDIRVLDLAGEPGMYCTKLLAELGADVIKVEPPGGDPARHIGPFYQEDVDPNKSLCFFALNTSKRAITLDVATSDGQALLRRLVAGSDVLVETFPPGYLDGVGLGYESLAAIKPDLIHCSITGFGLWGAHSHCKAPDIITIAMSGMMYLAGYPEDPPNRPYGNQSYYCASIQAASGIMAALLHRDRTGEGQQVEVSTQEALSMNQETAMQYWDIRKEVHKRIGNERRLPGIGVYECKNGHVQMMVGVPGFGAGLPVLVQWMAEEDAAGDLLSEDWQEVFKQIDMRLLAQLYFGADEEMKRTWQARFAHIDALLVKFVLRYDKEHLYAEAQARNLLVTPVNTPKDVVEDAQLNHRQWFVSVEHPELGASIQYPGPPYRPQETPWRIRRRPPRIGEHNQEVFCGELGLSNEELAALSAARVI